MARPAAACHLTAAASSAPHSQSATAVKAAAPSHWPTAELGVLFSGGVDSMVVAAIAHRHCPPRQVIDLLTVCFDGGRSPDRAAAIDGLAELRDACPGRLWRLVFVDATLAQVDAVAPHLAAVLHPSDTVMDLNIGAAIWMAARGEGWIDAADLTAHWPAATASHCSTDASSAPRS
uniref:Asparagine synthetase domain-containing protein n=1 Tax=Mantoniella antarctica TaxID=81844 RepID=A0A7S0S7M8_9CHLO|mmetsp:Transcript_12761/g.31020  ORF Transcript_12761/g.31020 Transcript_12761/m.31020 type:complete len:176 (+) Transcript_12761:854-1381(+)